ncbi:RING finger protein 10 isoform X2 [Exaiptasia diaphana]|uniref:E3 ubiquitin-protein ligase RNF10 n=1 Tax=Exaiptasia diaphana TaxID=2652724 RepID=A0A913X6J7_EXADI|nr:RING finger protein 10 isoform X2 [Exaiptasia diaphana]
MSEERNGQMERRTTQGVVPASPSPRSSSSKETVPKGKQWRGGAKRSNKQYYPEKQGYPQRSSSQYQRYVKRPGQRGDYQSTVSRNNNAGEVDVPVNSPTEKGPSGSKKFTNSLNSLLNFKYAPRERSYNQRVKFTGKRHNFNKERFLQANCQFVVNDTADYTVYGIDPDLLVDWSLVEQVRIFSHEVPSCPICLYPPKAAKITRCGHVYCWSCILHYLSLSENSWGKCPICFESIIKQDLKSVVAMESHHFNVGQTITMKLMKKVKNTTQALPVSQWQEREMKPFNINDSVNKCYSKLLLASPNDVLKEIIEQEETALNAQLAEAKLEQSSEVCFIESAQTELKVRKDGLQGEQKTVEEVCESLERLTPPSSDEGSSDDNQDENPGWNVYRPDNPDNQGVEFEAAFSDDESVAESNGYRNGSITNEINSKERSNSQQSCDSENTSQEITQETEVAPSKCDFASSDTNIPEKKGSFDSNQDQTYSYFYQADDGQNIFLHPINARCLIKEYGSLEKCPECISASILELEAMSQTEETRKRYRYLNHLPLTCEFVICELELKPPVVSSDTLDIFRVEIQKRKQRRQKKIKVEKRRELKVDAKMASIDGRPVISMRQAAEELNLNSDVDFPKQSALAMAMSPLGHKPGPFAQFTDATTVFNDAESVVEPVGLEASGMSPPSFAQALRAGKAMEFSKPIKRQQQEEARDIPKTGNGYDSDEDYVPPPTYQSTFSDALSVAISESLDNHLNSGAGQSIGKVGGGKHKKKPKKKLLFTTGHMKFN